MNFGYVKVGAYTPKIKVADVDYNVLRIKEGIDLAVGSGVNLLAFPELSITGYTCGDLFYQESLLSSAKSGLLEIARYTSGKNCLFFVGLPFFYDGLIYNTSACLYNGKILGIVPKSFLPNYSEFYEKRYFSSGKDKTFLVDIGENEKVPFGKNLIFADKSNPSFKVASEICEDLWTPFSPSIYHAISGARIIVNLSSSDEVSGKMEERRNLVKTHSSKIISAYIYANSGDGESTTDTVFSGHNLIAESGNILAESTPFKNGLITAEVDLSYIDYQRSRVFNQDFSVDKGAYTFIEFSVKLNDKIERKYEKLPFISEGEEEHLINMQANALKKRIEHTGAKTLVLGLSGGLDSALAAIVCKRTTEIMGRDPKSVLAFTMPCFGTSTRTFDNSIELAKALGISIKKIPIGKSVERHLKDIGHDSETTDACYENAQARERTQVLMDVANMQNGLVVGTGDLSELALGWATYNGDHMSNYGVNASIPKTLVGHLVRWYAEKSRGKLKWVLLDILDTPISPELTPTEGDKIKQKTEDLVGPYVLHDFFLYHIVKCGFSPTKVFYAALRTFKGEFDGKTIKKWLYTFVKRFFAQQFKRSCLPDGVKVSCITLSPRGGWRMPSDGVSSLWLKEIEEIEV